MKTPDIEIYVKDAQFQQILDWLNLYFKGIEFPGKAAHLYANGKPVRGTLGQAENKLELVITPKAAGKDFTSLWFKQNLTPWENDEQCALSLLEQADIEIRCSAAGWEEDEAINSEQWWLLRRDEKKRINWAG